MTVSSEYYTNLALLVLVAFICQRPPFLLILVLC